MPFINFSSFLNSEIIENHEFREFVIGSMKDDTQRESLKKALEFIIINKGSNVKPVSFIRSIGINDDHETVSFGTFIERIAFNSSKKTDSKNDTEITPATNHRVRESVKSIKTSKIYNKNCLFQIMSTVKCKECDFESFNFNEKAFIKCDKFRKDLNFAENMKRVFMEEEYVYKECEFCGKEFTTSEHILKKSFTVLGDYLIFISKTGFEISGEKTLDLSEYCEMNISNCVFNIVLDSKNIVIYEKEY